MKNIKDFLTRHVFITIFLYFSFMLATAWAVSEHIAARTKLAVLPADDDVLAIYDTSTTSGKGIAVSVFRGTNLNAIVDACEGVAAPAIGLYDSQNAGTDVTCGTGDKLAATVGANCPDVDTAGNEDCDITFNSMNAGTNTQRAMFDATDTGGGQWEFNYPITAPRFDGGISFSVVTSAGVASIDMDTSYPGICRGAFRWYNGDDDGAIPITLPAEPVCGGGSGNTVDAKDLTFFHDDSTEGDDFRLDPNGTDRIKYEGTLCGAGLYLECTTEGSSVRLLGEDTNGTSDIWVVIDTANGTTCACETP